MVKHKLGFRDFIKYALDDIVTRLVKVAYDGIFSLIVKLAGAFVVLYISAAIPLFLYNRFLRPMSKEEEFNESIINWQYNLTLLYDIIFPVMTVLGGIFITLLIYFSLKNGLSGFFKSRLSKIEEGENINKDNLYIGSFIFEEEALTAIEQNEGASLMSLSAVARLCSLLASHCDYNILDEGLFQIEFRGQGYYKRITHILNIKRESSLYEVSLKTENTLHERPSI